MGCVIYVQGQHWQVRGGMQAWKVETYCGRQRKYFCICAIVELLQNKWHIFGGCRQKVSMRLFALNFTLGKRSISGKRNAETGLYEGVKILVKM